MSESALKLAYFRLFFGQVVHFSNLRFEMALEPMYKANVQIVQNPNCKSGAICRATDLSLCMKIGAKEFFDLLESVPLANIQVCAFIALLHPNLHIFTVIAGFH